MNIHKKIGPFPVWAWGVTIAGGLLLGLYLRHRGKASSSANQTIGDYLAGAGGGGIADPNAGLDSNGALSGLLQQNQEVLDYLLSLAGGSSIPAIPDPPTYGPQPAAQPSNVASSGGSGASPNPNPAAPAPTDSTFTATTPLDVYSGGQLVQSNLTAPYFDPTRPASELYASVGLAPSSPFTLLPAGSSTGPNAQLAAEAQPVYDLSGPAPVQVGTTADMPRVPVGKVYAT